MADRITQIFEINADQALKTLADLNTSMDAVNQKFTALGGMNLNLAGLNGLSAKLRGAAAALAKLQGQAGGVGAGLSGAFNAGASAAGNATRQARGTLSTVDDLNKKVGGLTLTWQTFARVIATQFTVSEFARFRQILRDSVVDTIEFNRQLARTSVLARGSNARALGRGLTRASDDLNINRNDLASAFDEAVSNQVSQSTTETERFTTAAAKLSKITGQDVTAAVNSLSGALRAYQLDAGQSEKLAAKLAVAIDKGRVTISELDTNLGRVAGPANALGVSFDEVAAALSAVTDKGIQTSRATTQIAGVLNSLRKPTEALRGVLTDLGFESGQAAIETLGFGETLKAISDAAGGSQEALAKFFPNLRGFDGLIAITSDLQFFNDTLAEVKAATSTDLNNKLFKATANDSEQLSKGFNQLKNDIAEAFAQPFIQQSAKLLGENLESIRFGVRALSAAAKDQIPTLTVLAASFTALKVAIVATSGPIGGLVVAGGALVATLTALKQSKIEIANAPLEKARKELEAAAKAQDELTQKRLDDAADTDKKLLASSLRRIREENKAFIDGLRAARQAGESFVNSTSSLFGAVFSQQESLVAKLGNKINGIADKIAESTQRIQGLESNRDTRRFERSISNLDPETQALRRLERAQQLARTAEDDFRRAVRAGDEAGIANAREKLASAEQLASDAETSTDSSVVKNRAASAVDSIQGRQIELEKEAQRIEKERLPQLEKFAARQQAITEELRKQVDIVNANSNLFDANGDPLRGRKLADTLARRENATNRIQQLRGESRAEAGQLGLETIFQEIDSAFSERSFAVNLQLNQQSLADILSQSQAALGSFSADSAQGLANFLGDGRSVETLTELQRAATDAATEVDGLRRKQENAAKAARQLAEQQALVEAALKPLGESTDLAKLEQLGGPDAQLVQDMRALGDAIRSLSGDSELSSEKLKELLPLITRIKDSQSSFNFVQNSLTTTGNQSLLNSLRQLQELATLQDSLKSPELQKEIGFTEADLDRLRQGELILQNFSEIPDSFRQGDDTASSIEAKSARTRDNYVSAALAAAQAAGAGNTPLTQYLGGVGLRYFASGGFARGVDTQPAMLAAGESVINARATQQFFSQFQAINAGRTPVYRNQGSVTTIGDINVTVQGGNSSAQTVQSIALGLRRELRKGTIR